MTSRLSPPAVDVSPARESESVGMFTFTAGELQLYQYTLKYYHRDLAYRGIRFTQEQETTRLSLCQRLEAESDRAKDESGQVAFTRKEVALIENSLIIMQRLVGKMPEITSALSHLREETRLIVAVLAAEEE